MPNFPALSLVAQGHPRVVSLWWTRRPVRVRSGQSSRPSAQATRKSECPGSGLMLVSSIRTRPPPLSAMPPMWIGPGGDHVPCARYLGGPRRLRAQGRRCRRVRPRTRRRRLRARCRWSSPCVPWVPPGCVIRGAGLAREMSAACQKSAATWRVAAVTWRCRRWWRHRWRRSPDGVASPGRELEAVPACRRGRQDRGTRSSPVPD